MSIPDLQQIEAVPHIQVSTSLSDSEHKLCDYLLGFHNMDFVVENRHREVHNVVSPVVEDFQGITWSFSDKHKDNQDLQFLVCRMMQSFAYKVFDEMLTRETKLQHQRKLLKSWMFKYKFGKEEETKQENIVSAQFVLPIISVHVVDRYNEEKDSLQKLVFLRIVEAHRQISRLGEKESGQELFSATTNVSACECSLITVAEALRDFFQSSDKSFSKLRGDYPFPPKSVMQLLELFCYLESGYEVENNSQNRDCVTQGLKVVWSLIFMSTKLQNDCLEIELQNVIHHLAEIRMKAICLVANKLYYLLFIPQQIEEFVKDQEGSFKCLMTIKVSDSIGETWFLAFNNEAEKEIHPWNGKPLFYTVLTTREEKVLYILLSPTVLFQDQMQAVYWLHKDKYKLHESDVAVLNVVQQKLKKMKHSKSWMLKFKNSSRTRNTDFHGALRHCPYEKLKDEAKTREVVVLESIVSSLRQHSRYKTQKFHVHMKSKMKQKWRDGQKGSSIKYKKHLCLILMAQLQLHFNWALRRQL